MLQKCSNGIKKRRPIKTEDEFDIISTFYKIFNFSTYSCDCNHLFNYILIIFNCNRTSWCTVRYDDASKIALAKTCPNMVSLHDDLCTCFYYIYYMYIICIHVFILLCIIYVFIIYYICLTIMRS